MRVVLAVGSRDVLKEHQLKTIRRILGKPCILITGDAPGCDYVAYNLARELNYDAVAVHAFWEKYGHAAGPERNSMLVFLATLLSLFGCELECHAFPADDSSGTWDTVNKLKKSGFEVQIHR